MSHGRERHEKNCLNCGTTVAGRFCQVCGQENIEPKESFGQLLSHFFNDITHFDGKFFHSLKYIFTRPGHLPKEYVKGRRASYLNPIRMYIFTSAIFFLIFFAFFVTKAPIGELNINGKTETAISKMDSATFAAFTANINKEDDKAAVPMTREEFKKYLDSVKAEFTISLSNHKYKSREEYDSLRRVGKIKHGWIRRQFVYKEIEVGEKYNHDEKRISEAFKETFLHSIPQILFISLPILALLLRLIYIRRKEFYYISHLIFALYLYIFIFLALLAIFGVSKLNSALDWRLLSWLNTALVIAIFFYEYKAMHNFYKQGWFKTLIKFLLINLLFLITLFILFFAFLLLSMFKI